MVVCGNTSILPCIVIYSGYVFKNRPADLNPHIAVFLRIK